MYLYFGDVIRCVWLNFALADNVRSYDGILHWRIMSVSIRIHQKWQKWQKVGHCGRVQLLLLHKFGIVFYWILESSNKISDVKSVEIRCTISLWVNIVLCMYVCVYVCYIVYIVQYSTECSIQHVGAPCLMFAVSRSCLPQCWSMLGHRHNHQSHIE